MALWYQGLRMSESARSGIDPATGKPLPKGGWYRSVDQYQARKMIDGKRLSKDLCILSSGSSLAH
ncbi:hypothetical protein AA105894_2063 [Asaia spathodeae NBRC 105894]|nr:hypothetical protein AA105894_2063 [Asaia spathodeae NBRC 105894]